MALLCDDKEVWKMISPFWIFDLVLEASLVLEVQAVYANIKRNSIEIGGKAFIGLWFQFLKYYKRITNLIIFYFTIFIKKIKLRFD